MPENDDSHVDLVMICPHLGDGGSQRVVSTLANSWSQQGRKVCVITIYKHHDVYHLDPSIHRIRIDGFTGENAVLKLILNMLKFTGLKRFITKLLSMRIIQYIVWIIYPLMYIYIFYQIWRIRSVIKQIDTPVILSFVGSTNILTILSCMGVGKRVIISERNDPARQFLQHPWNGLRRILYNYADVVTANSHGALKSMETYVDKRKLKFVPNPFVYSKINTSLTPTASFKAPFILIVGRLHDQKAHDVLLEAFAHLYPKLDKWRLAIVGSGELEEVLQVQATALGIAELIDWYGQVDDPFIFYHAARIFVLPSRHEGMPNALLEAMSCGLPVIVSDASPGPLELVRHMETGLVFPVDDAAALSAAMELLATNAVLSKRLGEAGRNLISDYDLPKVLPIWEQIIGL